MNQDRLSQNGIHHNKTSYLQDLPTKSAGNNAVGSSSRVASINDYVLALRPWSFCTSIIPVILGSVLGYKCTSQFNVLILMVTLVTVIAVHGAGNLVNTFYDYVKGIDNKKKSDDRTLVDRILTPDEVVNLGVILYVVGCLGFVCLVYLSPAKMEQLALVYFGGLSCSFLYTGGIGLKYIALGDLLIITIFGPVSVLFSYMSQTGTFNLLTLLYAIPLALNAEAILHSNNTRDIYDDQRAGVVTFAILIGPTCSHIFFALLVFIPYILFTVTSFHYTYWLLLPLITLPKAFEIERQFRMNKILRIPKQVAQLNLYFGLFYIIGCWLADSRQLPGLNIK